MGLAVTTPPPVSAVNLLATSHLVRDALSDDRVTPHAVSDVTPTRLHVTWSPYSGALWQTGVHKITCPVTRLGPQDKLWTLRQGKKHSERVEANPDMCVARRDPLSTPPRPHHVQIVFVDKMARCSR